VREETLVVSSRSSEKRLQRLGFVRVSRCLPTASSGKNELVQQAAAKTHARHLLRHRPP
jgi:hypothetical protein